MKNVQYAQIFAILIAYVTCPVFIDYFQLFYDFGLVWTSEVFTWCTALASDFIWMGDCITRPINVTLIEMIGAAPKKDSATTAEDSAPVENGDPVVEGFSEEPASAATNQTINHPFVFHQYGNNSIQVGNIETLVINNSGGEKREQ